MSDVLFTGEFDLKQATEEFAKFANNIQQRLAAISSQATKGGAAKEVTKELDAETKRQQKITDQHLAHNIENAKKQSKAEVAEIRLRVREQQQAQKDQERMTREHLLYNIAQAKANTKAQQNEFKAQVKAEQDALNDRAKSIQHFFTAFTIGGFALQRFGQFLERAVSEPLKNLVANLYDTTLAVDDFEQVLRTRGGKTTEEIDAIYKAVLRVSNLPNLERPDVLQLFTRLTEATQGGLAADQLERIGAGISKISTTLEAGEKRAFFGQLQDILGGGNVANIQKTLSLVPLLAVTYNKLALEAKEAGKAVNQTTLIIQALESLADLPNVNNIATKIKAIRNELFEFSRRIGQVYKEDLVRLVDFINANVLPTLERLLDWFEKASPAIHAFAAIIVGLGIVIPPLIGTLGAFGIAIGGIGYAIEGFASASAAIEGLAASGGLLGEFLSFLPRIPSLITPIGAAIVGVIAVLTQAFSDNTGGFRDALNTLVSTLLPTLISLIKTIFDTVTSLIAIVVNLYKAIDAIVQGGLTEAIALAASGLAYLLTIVLSLLNLLQIIPATLQLIADILSGDVELAFTKFYLTLLKVVQAIGKVFGLDLSEEIAKTEKEVSRLDGTTREMYDANADKGEKSLEQQKAIEKAYQQTQQTVQLLSDAIKEQSKAIDENTFKLAANTQERIRNAEAGRNARDAAFYGNVGASFDLTSFEGQQGAESALAKETAAIEAEAKTKTDSATQKAFRQALVDRQQKILEFIDKELNEDTKEFYKKFAELYATALRSPGDLSPDVLNKTIYKVLTQELTKRFKIDSPELPKIKENIANERVILDEIYKSASSNLDLIQQAQSDSAAKRAALAQKIRDANQKLQEQQAEDVRLRPLLDQDDEYKTFIKLGQDEIKNRTKDKATITSLTQLDKELTAQMDDLIKWENLYYQNQLAIIEASIGTNGEKIEKRRKAYQDYLKAVRDDKILKEETYNTFVTELVNDKILNSERFRKLLTTFGDEIKDQIDLTITAAGEGVTPNFDKLKESSRKFNQIVQDTANSLSQDALKALTTASQTLKVIGANLKPSDDTKGLFDFIDKMGTLKNHTYLDKDEVDKLLITAEGMVNVIKALASAPGLTKEQTAEYNLALDNLIKGIDSLKSAKGTLKDVVDIDLSKLQVDEKLLDHQKATNDALKNQLDLELKILETRRDRLSSSEFPILSKIFNIVNGNYAAIEAAQLRILENQKKAATIELNLAIVRLEAEQKITLEKEKQAGVSEEEREKLKKAYEDEIEQLKETGKLQQELLDEQINAQDKLSGGGIVGVFKGLFGRKKKTPTTGTISGGNVTIDPDAINAGQIPTTPPVVPDDAANKTAKNVKSQLGWLDKLTGGLGRTKDAIFGIGDAISQMNDLSIKGILKVFAAELKALAIKATIKALEYTAVAAAALIYGDVATARRAGKAAALWGVVAAAAAAGSALLGHIAGTSTANAQSSASSAAGGSGTGTYNPQTDPTVLRQKGYAIQIQFDIRTDDGIIIKKNIKALNNNTELTNLTANSADGWAFAPAP
jgi:hypothetical protein